MEILFNREASAAETPQGAQARIYLLGIRIVNVQTYAEKMVETISETNWIQKLNPLAKASYEATSLRTIGKLVDVFNTTNGRISKDFGEFMVSLSAIQALSDSLEHTAFPLSEIWKEKLTGNHGFDYFTECEAHLINCGEAKFKSSGNSYGSAAKQVCEFIDQEKDKVDLPHLINFAGDVAINRLVTDRERGFCLAFSVDSQNMEQIVVNALSNLDVIRLAGESNSLYLIGVETS